MTHSHPYPYADLQGAAHRNTTAVELLAAFAKSAPALDDMWRHLFAALADTPTLINEIDRLRTALAAARYQRANLIAAIRATLAAHHDGEHDPLYYIRDELHAQTHMGGGGR
ncbi:hypothetical protein [Nonomuraea sediminis]|uniref:hypothetical protein n=1 Tax=Nonomuraea sediminis TaxID=2835864 RepID=UPI001BDCB638|nr:hypothetical protein [Nonomuraea sediminis]